ncbi:MAG: hypothetical protein AAES65_03390 [Candidatus Thiodiazotropha sp. (ex. Lucinoma kazani)]
MSQLQPFSVRYIDVDGSRRRIGVNGIDKQDARRRAVDQGIADSRITAVGRGGSPIELWQRLTEKKDRRYRPDADLHPDGRFGCLRLSRHSD